MKGYISLSTTPSMEDCAAVGDENYMKNSRLEARVYARQLHRVYGMNPPGTEFKIMLCPHDFGSYLDLEFHYNDEDRRHVAYMAALDEGCLEWDKEALRELQQGNYPLLPEKKKRSAAAFADFMDEDGYTTDNSPTGHGDVCMSDADPGL